MSDVAPPTNQQLAPWRGSAEEIVILSAKTRSEVEHWAIKTKYWEKKFPEDEQLRAKLSSTTNRLFLKNMALCAAIYAYFSTFSVTKNVKYIFTIFILTNSCNC